MIGRLVGRVVAEDPAGSIVLDVSGVGYEVLTPVGTLGRAPSEAGGVVLTIHTHVREDAFELFGFASEAERKVFRLLIGVPNVGPKTALGLLSALPVEDLAACIDASDLARLTRVPGIGKKTGERLLLELKDKLPKLGRGKPQPTSGGAAGRDDGRRLATALTNMGYRAAEADRAVKSLGDRVGREPIADLLREALALLTP